MHKYSKARWLTVFIAVFFLLLVLATPFLKNRLLFTRVTDEFWKEQLLNDTLSMHYTVARPENWGLEDYQALLPAYCAGMQEDSSAKLEEYLSSLSSISKNLLKEQDRIAYDLLYRYLSAENEMKNFPYYHEPLAPGSGAQSQLPILLAEYSFAGKRDVEDYLALLEDLGPYFDGLAVYEQEKSAAGLFMSDDAVDKLITQCDTIMNPQELRDGTHFLQTTFSQRLAALAAQGIITGEERKIYESENDRLLLTAVQPAYERLADSLFLLKGSGSAKGGLSSYPGGREYYALMVRRETGSSKSVEQLKQLLLSRFEQDCGMLQSLLSDSLQNARESSTMKAAPETGAAAPDLSVSVLNQIAPASPLYTLSPEDMLEHLQASMQQDFPAFPASSDPSVSPECVVKSVSDSLEPFTAPAFYLTPPLDNISSNVIYINESATPKGLSLYTTLAHEGYPGHLYQSVYYNLHRENASISPARSLLYYGGYVEGWALYVENLSYDYAESLLSSDSEKLACSMTRLDRDMQLCLYALLDLSIHYDGASYEKVHSILQRFGIADPAVTHAIYEYIVEEPSNYLKYYVGYLEILELKEAARNLWKDAYTEKAFHTFFLEAGPCDYKALHELLEQTKAA